MLDIRVDPYGFVKTDPGSPSRTSERGIFVCGMASSPKDIAESVSSAVEASASVMEHVGI
jgi:heterodisulfide reductase subunit A-like polyferredoxin